jgi:hypothetical protein
MPIRRGQRPRRGPPKLVKAVAAEPVERGCDREVARIEPALVASTVPLWSRRGFTIDRLQAAVAAAGGAVTLAKAIEDVGHQVRDDALAVIGDHDLGAVVVLAEADRDHAAGPVELHGVREQVPDDLLEARGVALDEDAGRIEGGLDGRLAGRGGRIMSTAV